MSKKRIGQLIPPTLTQLNGMSNSEVPVHLPQRRGMVANSSSLDVPVNVQDVPAIPLPTVAVPDGNEVPDDASIKLKNAYLVKFTAKQKEQISVLTKIVQKFQEDQEKPRCCQIPYVKKMMTNVACKLLIGHYKFSSIYPSEDTVIECLLASFQVPIDDQATRSVFLKEWTICKKGEKGLKGVVCDNIVLRRGNMTRDLKNHLFALLRLLKPSPQSGEEALEEWKRRVEEVKMGEKWRTSNDTGVMDPYGSIAAHGAISYVMLGRCYAIDEPVRVTLEQAGFFFHVMELALNFKTLSEGCMTSQIRLMKLKKKV